VTSFSGEVGLPYRTAYCASKFAVTGFLESLRSEMSVAQPQEQSFHITIVCPPTVATNLRANSLSAGTTSTGLPAEKGAGEGAMSVADCASAIVDAGDRRLRKAFFPLTSWIASYLRPIIPDAMDKLIMQRAKL
jgi:short-subunit dehydrogenase